MYRGEAGHKKSLRKSPVVLKAAITFPPGEPSQGEGRTERNHLCKGDNEYSNMQAGKRPRWGDSPRLLELQP